MGPRGMRGMGHGRQRTNWNSSNRGSRLPDDWPERRAKVRGRAHGLCQAKQHVPECDGIGTATTSSPATTTALTTCNGCRILVIKRKRSVRTQRGTPSASECENIRRNVSPACSTDPSGVGGDSPGLPVKPPDSTSGHACAQNARFSRYLIFIGTFPAVPFLAALFAVWSQVAFSRGSDRLVGARFFM